MKYQIIVLIILIVSVRVYAQQINLVHNPGFEDFDTIDTKSIIELMSIKYWEALEPTPDIFDTRRVCAKKCYHDCGITDVHEIPYKNLPRSGHGFGGMINDFYSDYLGSEKLYVPLTETLKKGYTYHVGFYYRLCAKATLYSKFLGMIFCKDDCREKPPKYYFLEKLYNPKATFFCPAMAAQHDTNTYMTDSLNWQCIDNFYVANGTEKFLAIGNFQRKNGFQSRVDYEKLSDISDAQIKSLKDIKAKNPNGYVLIDDVFVYQVQDTMRYNDSVRVVRKKEKHISDSISKPIPSIDFKSLGIGNSNAFRKLNFNSNSSEIKFSSYFELDNLAEYLRKKPEIKISISGHTDNVGNPKDNKKLSEARAKAVADYLIKKGVILSRINFKGFGDTVPIADNNTETGRTKNRRVEFVFE